MGPSFSICIPNYNYAHYLRTTLDSVFAQTYDNFEVVIADNASTDDSVAVAESYGERVRIIRNKYNVGFAPNIDKATFTAKNDYMIVISSDDVMHPKALETYAKVIEELGDDAHGAILTSAIDIIDAQGKLTGVSYRPANDLMYRTVGVDDIPDINWENLPWSKTRGTSALERTLRVKDSPAVFLATCYSRAMYESVEGYNSGYRMWPDGHFLNKVLAQPEATLIYVPQRLFQYRLHNQNQLANEARAGALKYQVDSYLHTIEFPKDVLDTIGMRREDLVDVFVEKAVMERGLQAIAMGNAEKALKCFAFGFATYPKAAIRQPKTFALAGLLALGPAGAPVAGRLYDWYQKRNTRR